MQVITEQRIRVTTLVRQSWFHSTIYIYSANEMGHCNIEKLDGMLIGAPIMNRETNEIEWDKRPLNLKEDIFVKNNIIRIRRSILFCDLKDGKQVTRSDRRTYNNLCPAEVTNAAQREVYGNVALRPQSMLNVTSILGEQRSINGNIRLIEKLIITLSSGKEPLAIHRLQNQVEERIIKPENCDIPMQYVEDILIGQRRIDITREADIKPPKGLSEFMTAGQPQVFEFGERRRYGNFVVLTSQSLGHTQPSYTIRRSPPRLSTDGQIGQVKDTMSQFPYRYQSQSSEVGNEQLKGNVVDDARIPPDLRSKKSSLIRRGPRRSSRWSRFALSRSRSHADSTESVRTVPATFSPLETSTPVKKCPIKAKEQSDRNRVLIEKYMRTSRSQSSGTGTHIRSTLDCDITRELYFIGTTKEVDVTEIPIEIKGELNGFPWCTTIRLRVKHDANEKPTFIPNQCKVF
uniref:Uncharacterized protein n=1 Tax=Loa loa TaxID=7209 RepID=A0A1I7VL71_LOALO